MPSIDLDLSDISLDLEEPQGESSDMGLGDGSDPVSTKLDLAKAYLDMGDREGAREILVEVEQEGSSAQQGEARRLLKELG